MAEIAYAVLNISTMPAYLQYDRQFGASVLGSSLQRFYCAKPFSGFAVQLLTDLAESGS
jgi:hypothetical protein